MIIKSTISWESWSILCNWSIASNKSIKFFIKSIQWNKINFLNIFIIKESKIKTLEQSISAVYDPSIIYISMIYIYRKWLIKYNDMLLSLIHQILLLFLLFLDQRVYQGIQESVKSRINRWATLFNTGIENFHVWSCLQSLWLFLSCRSWKMLRKGYALRNGDIESLWEFFNPHISLSLRFWIISIENDNNSLCLLLNPWPNPIILDVSYIKTCIPDTSQNSIEMSLLSTYD